MPGDAGVVFHGLRNNATAYLLEAGYREAGGLAGDRDVSCNDRSLW